MARTRGETTTKILPLLVVLLPYNLIIILLYNDVIILLYSTVIILLQYSNYTSIRLS